MLPLLLAVGLPSQGLATPLEQPDVDFLNSLGDRIATVDVMVYNPGDIASYTYAGGSLGEEDYLYKYTVTNTATISRSIITFYLDLEAKAPISKLWPAEYFPTFSAESGDVYFNSLFLDVGDYVELYIVSTAAPLLYKASIQATGSKGVATASVYAPDPSRQIPEPATLLLLGSGLIGIGLARRKRLGKRG